MPIAVADIDEFEKKQQPPRGLLGYGVEQQQPQMPAGPLSVSDIDAFESGQKAPPTTPALSAADIDAFEQTRPAQAQKFKEEIMKAPSAPPVTAGDIVSRHGAAVLTKTAESLNMGTASFMQTLADIDRLVRDDKLAPIDPMTSALNAASRTIKPETIEKGMQFFLDNAEQWEEENKQFKPNIIDDLVGEAIGGAIPGVGEFMLNVPWAILKGAAEAHKRGDSELWGALRGGAERFILGKIFHAIGKLPKVAAVPATGVVFGGQVAIEGGTPEEIAKGVGTGLLYGLMGGKRAKEITPERKTGIVREIRTRAMLPEANDRALTLDEVIELKNARPIREMGLIDDLNRLIIEKKGMELEQGIIPLRAEDLIRPEVAPPEEVIPAPAIPAPAEVTPPAETIAPALDLGRNRFGTEVLPEPAGVQPLTKPEMVEKALAIQPYKSTALTAIRKAGGINPETAQGEAERYTRKEGKTTGIVSKKGIADDRMREHLQEQGYLPEESTVNDMYDLIGEEFRREERGKAQVEHQQYQNHVEATYGKDWRESEGFKRDEAIVKTDLEEEVKGEVAAEEEATAEEVKALSQYFEEAANEVFAETKVPFKLTPTEPKRKTAAEKQAEAQGELGLGGVKLTGPTPEARAMGFELTQKKQQAGWEEKVGGMFKKEQELLLAPAEKKPAVKEELVTEKDKKQAMRLRGSADKMTKTIEEKRNPAIAQQNLTARRARIASSMAEDADRLELIQSKMYAIAEAIETNTLPKTLEKVGSKKAIEILTYAREIPRQNGHEWEQENYGSLERAGITTAKQFQQAKADLEAIGKKIPTEPTAEQKIKELERGLIGRKIQGWFPTPKPVVEKMLAEADIGEGMKVLEPSAGKGDIADLIKSEHPEADLKTIEISGELTKILETKGYDVVDRDFLEHKGKYDRIIMNPPYEKGQDIDHVRHAYELLKPGGRIVSLMGEGTFFRTTKKDVAFRDWLEERGGTSEKLAEKSFTGKEAFRQTGVAARMVVIDKPAESTLPAHTEGEVSAEVAARPMEFFAYDTRRNKIKPLLAGAEDYAPKADEIKIQRNNATDKVEISALGEKVTRDRAEKLLPDIKLPEPGGMPEKTPVYEIGAPTTLLSIANIPLDRTNTENLRGAVNTVRKALKDVLPDDIYGRIRLEMKPALDLQGRNLEKTLADHGGTVKVSEILGATTIDNMNAIVQVAYGHGNKDVMKTTAYHEAFHVTAKWVLPEKDYSRLMKEFEGNEEKAADAFADFTAEQKGKGFVQRVFATLKRVFEQVRSALQGQRFNTPDAIFAKILGKKYEATLPTETIGAQIEGRESVEAVKPQKTWGETRFRVGDQEIPAKSKIEHDYLNDFRLKTDPEKPDEVDFAKEPTTEQTSNFIKNEAVAMGRTIADTFKNRPASSIFEKLLASPEFYKHPVHKELVRISVDSNNRYHELLNDSNKIDDPRIPFETVTEATEALARKGISWAQYKLGRQSREKRLLDKIVDEGDVEQKDPAAFEQELRQRRVPEDVIQAWKLMRTGYDKHLDKMLGPLKEEKARIDEEAAFLGKEPIYPKLLKMEDAEGKERVFSLPELIGEVEKYKGSYAPRIRVGDWVVTGKKGEAPSLYGTGEYYREHTRTRLQANRLKIKLESQGWKNVEVSERGKIPESTYQIINVMETAKFLEKSVEGIATDPETKIKLLESVLDQAAEFIKERGYLKHTIHRQKGVVVRGYITDSAERFIRYLSNVSAGLAKAEKARKLSTAFFGEYVDGKKVGGIDPVREPRAYEVGRKYIEEQLRNPDRSDRIIALGKSVASMKFLGLNPRSIAVNLTSMVTSVPAAIRQYATNARAGFLEIGKAELKAGRDYARFMVGKYKPHDVAENVFLNELQQANYDRPQYAREATGRIRDAYGKTWGQVVSGGMWAFGKSEQWMRGSTMLAAFRLAKKYGADTAEATQRALQSSNRAHGSYGKETLPWWAQGSNPAAKIGQMLYTYAKFPHTYVQTMRELGFSRHDIKGMMWMLAAPVIIGGTASLPFKDELVKLVGGIMHILGDDRDPERMVWDGVRGYLGEGGEQIGRYGLFGAAGIDLSGSLSIGVGVPRNLTELTGPIGGAFSEINRGLGYLGTGQPGRATETLLPSGVGNVLRAVRELKGITTRTGRRVWDENGRPLMPTGAETGLRVAGFRSSRQATLAARTTEAKREAAGFDQRRANIYEEYRALYIEPTPEKLADFAETVQEFNADVVRAGVQDTVPMITRQSLRNQARAMMRPSKKQRGYLGLASPIKLRSIKNPDISIKKQSTGLLNYGI